MCQGFRRSPIMPRSNCSPARRWCPRATRPALGSHWQRSLEAVPTARRGSAEGLPGAPTRCIALSPMHCANGVSARCVAIYQRPRNPVLGRGHQVERRGLPTANNSIATRILDMAIWAPASLVRTIVRCEGAKSECKTDMQTNADVAQVANLQKHPASKVEMTRAVRMTRSDSRGQWLAMRLKRICTPPEPHTRLPGHRGRRPRPYAACRGRRRRTRPPRNAIGSRGRGGATPHLENATHR